MIRELNVLFISRKKRLSQLAKRYRRPTGKWCSADAPAFGTCPSGTSPLAGPLGCNKLAIKENIRRSNTIRRHLQIGKKVVIAKKLTIPMMLLLFLATFLQAQKIVDDIDPDENIHKYIAKVSPSNVRRQGKSKFECVYDLAPYKKQDWYPPWAGEKTIKNRFNYIPGKEDVRNYLDSLPNKITLTFNISSCRFMVDCSEIRRSDKRVPSFTECLNNDFLPSVDQLLWRGKFSDDGLMAALEYYDEYTRKGLTRNDFYNRLCSSVLKLIDSTGAMGQGARTLAAKLWTARTFAGDSLPRVIKANRDILNKIEKESKYFHNYTVIWKPISFYSWTENLQYIYIRDKILKEPFFKNGLEAILVMLTILEEDTLLGETFFNDINRQVRLNGAPKYDFYELIKKECGKKSFKSVLNDSVLLKKLNVKLQNPGWDKYDKIALIPSAFSPEDRYTTSNTTSKDSMMSPFLEAIIKREVDLNPEPNGSWYEYQQYALEPLLTTEDLRERGKIVRSKNYNEKLKVTFQSLFAAHKETHINDLIGGLMGGHVPFYHNRIVLMISPLFRIEPLPEVYLRTSLAYSRLAQLMRALYNDKSITGIRPGNTYAALDALQEVHFLQKLYYGFYLISCEDIGLPPDTSFGDPDSTMYQAENFLSNLSEDTDMKQDIRFMIPVAIDPNVDSTLYWMVNGVNVSQTITIAFYDDPKIAFDNINPDQIIVMKTGFTKKIGVSDFSEVYLPGKNVLNRDEFRKVANEAENKVDKIKASFYKSTINKK